MSCERFKMIRFDNETPAQNVQTDKAAPTRGIWIMLNRNLEKPYKLYDCITIDEQLFPFRGHINLHGTYHLNLRNMASSFTGLAMHQTQTHYKVRFTLENQQMVPDK